MKPLRRFLDKLHPHFSKGGKLERLYPFYEGADTFLFTPGEVTTEGPHVRDAIDLKRLMSMVIVALLPCILMAMYNTGYQANVVIAAAETGADVTIHGYAGWRVTVMETLGLALDPTSLISNVVLGSLFFLPIYVVTMAAGGFWEGLFATVRRHEVNEGFLVTSMLFPLILPPTIPLWQVALGISFGVVFGKEIFGGTGKNFLNPALTGRCFLYFSYAKEMTGDAIWYGVSGADAVTKATPLGALANAAGQGAEKFKEELANVSFFENFIGFTVGSLGETSTLACLLGAIVLIGVGVGSWQIMVGVLLGGLGFSTILYLLPADANLLFGIPPHYHIVTGGFAFGLVFMATDPVSASMTAAGKWIYGALIGIVTILVRVMNPGYPEGIMLAILLGNVFAPVIDHYVLQANIKRRIKRNES
ncbi:MAG: NADH:ubiquinone reductase (Na(+)-transporting) subunit B [Pirellulaceae bacterium]|nr:NADH:ubiquinone reductase (Na(+)-transporting) subunit B [Pirellulaceae bacterium]